MSDDADRAAEQEEINLRINLSRVSPGAPLKATGSCHNCDRGVDHEQRFCDVECEAEYQWYKERTKG